MHEDNLHRESRYLPTANGPAGERTAEMAVVACGAGRRKCGEISERRPCQSTSGTPYFVPGPAFPKLSSVHRNKRWPKPSNG